MDAPEYEYTLRQYIMLRRVVKPYSTWTEVIDYTDAWFAKHPDVDPEDTASYLHWTNEVGIP